VHVTTTVRRPQPFLVPEYCKGCGRCVASCAKGCISLGTDIQPLTGLVPIVLDLTDCNGCGLCIDACPEPFGLRPDGEQGAFAPVDPALLGGDRPFDVAAADDIPDRIVPLPPLAPLVVKGTYASAVGRRAGGVPSRLRLSDHAVDRGGRADGEGATGSTACSCRRSARSRPST
jgi:ferredoxin